MTSGYARQDQIRWVFTAGRDEWFIYDIKPNCMRIQENRRESGGRPDFKIVFVDGFWTIIHDHLFGLFYLREGALAAVEAYINKHGVPTEGTD